MNSICIIETKKSLCKKTNRQLMWTSQYERNWLMVISSLHFLLETWNGIDKCSQNIGGIFWIYIGTPSTITPLSRPLWCCLPYDNALPFVSPTRPTRYPDRDHSPAVAKLLIEHRVTRPHILSVSLRWKTGKLSVAIYSAASCPKASWIQM